MRADPSHYGSEKIIAGAVVLALAVIAVVVPRVFAGWRAKRLAPKVKRTKAETANQKVARRYRRAQQQSQAPYFSLLLGKDGRLSTSKTIAALWTLIVAYILLALIFVWPSDWSKPLSKLWPTYVLLLGGPYASLVLAKAGTALRVSNGTLQKPQGTGDVRLSDLVGDDSGSPDLFDSQYVLFNVIAMIFVIDAFIRATLAGFPSIPEGLVLLTGGPAAVYLANKATTSNTPVIFSVRPSIVRPGDPFTIVGQNFAPEGAAGTGSTDGHAVEVGGQTAPAAAWTDTAVGANAPTPALPQANAVSVAVTTAAGATAYLDSALTISQAPVLGGLSAESAAVGSSVTASGSWSIPAGAAPTVRVAGLAAAVTEQPIPGSSVTFTVPSFDALPAEAFVNAPVRVVVAGLASNPATLKITPGKA